MRDGGLLKGKKRQAQHQEVQRKLRPIPVDDVMQDVFNVIIELRVNADKLEQVLSTLKEEED